MTRAKKPSHRITKNHIFKQIVLKIKFQTNMSTQYFHDIPIPKTFDCLFFLKKMNQFRKMIDTSDFFLF